MQLKTVELRNKVIEEMNARRQDGKTYIDSEWLLSQYEQAITQDRSNIRAVLKDWITKNEKELSDPYPFDSKYSYCDFVSASDLEEFLDTLLPGDVSK